MSAFLLAFLVAAIRKRIFRFAFASFLLVLLIAFFQQAHVFQLVLELHLRKFH
jgi:hypothetical protein